MIFPFCVLRPLLISYQTQKEMIIKPRCMSFVCRWYILSFSHVSKDGNNGSLVCRVRSRRKSECWIEWAHSTKCEQLKCAMRLFTCNKRRWQWSIYIFIEINFWKYKQKVYEFSCILATLRWLVDLSKSKAQLCFQANGCQCAVSTCSTNGMATTTHSLFVVHNFFSVHWITTFSFSNNKMLCAFYFDDEKEHNKFTNLPWNASIELLLNT